MEKISGLTTKDNSGIRRSFEWYDGGNNIHYVLRKAGNPTHNLKLSEARVREMFEDILDVREHMSDREMTERAVPNVDDLNFSTRVQLLNDLASSFSSNELSRINDNGFVEHPTRLMRLSGLSGGKKNWEKTSEDVLQMIWNNFQDDWFTSRRFIEEYNKMFDRNEARNKLRRLHMNGDLVRESVDDDEVEDGRIKYKYKLSYMALSRFSEFDGFAVDDNPAYVKKNAMIKR
jgi:hypothetical protein